MKPAEGATPPPAFVMSAARSISDEEFELFQSLVYRKAGIYLAPVKKALVVARLGKRLRELGLASFGAYYRYIEKNSESEIPFMLDRITTNETHFFREPQHFEFLKSTLFPIWDRQAEAGTRTKQITVWSAACSSGEEPYSLAMLLLDYYGPESGWKIVIKATDISNRILDKAKQAIWPIQKSAEIPEYFLKRFMLKGRGDQEGVMKVGPEIRSLVDFKWLNLNDENYDIDENFDLVFCRNALIYFNQESKSKVIHRLLDRLHPNGLLFLGHSESLNGVTDQVRNVVPSVYIRNSSAMVPALGLRAMQKRLRIVQPTAPAETTPNPAPTKEGDPNRS